MNIYKFNIERNSKIIWWYKRYDEISRYILSYIQTENNIDSLKQVLAWLNVIDIFMQVEIKEFNFSQVLRVIIYLVFDKTLLDYIYDEWDFIIIHEENFKSFLYDFLI